MGSYDHGDLVRVRGGFADRELTGAERAAWEAGGGLPAGTAVDPSTVALRVKRPDGSITTLAYGGGGAVQREAAGIYYADVSVDQKGEWTYRWEATGAGQAATRGHLFVASEW